MAYLNNAYTAISNLSAVKEAPPASTYAAAGSIARLLGVKKPENILFAESGSEAVKAAVKCFVKPGDHVISTVTEHRATLEALAGAEKDGSSVTYLPVNEYGVIRYDLLESSLKPETKAIVCSHGCALTGNIADMEKIGAFARRHRLLLIVDGGQSAGATPVNLEDLQIDVFCFSGHKKLMGPVGTGGICLRDGILPDREITDMLRTPSEEKLGRLKAAVDFILEKGIYGVSVFPHRLAKRFFESVSSMPDVKVYGDFGTNTRVPSVSVTVKGFSPKEIKDFMRENHIAIGAGDCDCPMMLPALGADGGVARFSFGYLNTRMEVNDAIWALMKLQKLDDLYYLA